MIWPLDISRVKLKVLKSQGNNLHCEKSSAYFDHDHIFISTRR